MPGVAPDEPGSNGTTGDGAGGSPSGTAEVGRNRWDFFTALAAVAFLAVMTWVLIKHYGQDASKAGTILGILVPAIGALFGVTLGYAAGSTSGQVKGAADAKKQIKEKLTGDLNRLQTQTDPVVTQIQQAGESPPGAGSVMLGDAEFDLEHLTDLASNVKSLRSYVQAL